VLFCFAVPSPARLSRFRNKCKSVCVSSCVRISSAYAWLFSSSSDAVCLQTKIVSRRMFDEVFVFTPIADGAGMDGPP